MSVRSVGRLDRSASTVSRELRRNTAGHDKGIFDANLAEARARAWGARPGRTRLVDDGVLGSVVQTKLELEWSPSRSFHTFVGSSRTGWILSCVTRRSTRASMEGPAVGSTATSPGGCGQLGPYVSVDDLQPNARVASCWRTKGSP